MSYDIFEQVAASNDDYGFQYKMVYRLQPSREEMIIDLANVMKEQLEFYIKKNGHEPQKIIYYRDGVSEGQFQQVRIMCNVGTLYRVIQILRHHRKLAFILVRQNLNRLLKYTLDSFFLCCAPAKNTAWSTLIV